MPSPVAQNDSLIISYVTLRKCIGYLGILLPFALAFGGLLIKADIESSISHYWHTDLRDIFVGTLCAIGVFLMAYLGYETKDNIAATVAGIAGIGTALFPTKPLDPSPQEALFGTFHWIFAALFFLTLVYISLCLFTKSDPAQPPTPHKLQRNRVYKIAGFVMLTALILIGVLGAFPSLRDDLQRYSPVFWLEAIAIVAFGVSWITKGEVILADESA